MAAIMMTAAQLQHF